MPVGFTVLESGTDTGLSVTTGTLNPTGTPLIVVAVFAGTGAPTSPSVSGCNLTWNEQTGGGITYASRRILTVWEGTGTPTSGTLSISASGNGSIGTIYAVLESADIDSVTAWATNSGTSTTASVTISGGGDLTLFFMAKEDTSSTLTEEAGTQLFDLTETGNVRRGFGYEDSAADTTPSVSIELADAWAAAGALFTEAAAGGDPEGPLVGGKLLRGGMLTRGRLV